MLCNSARTVAPRQLCTLRGLGHTSRFPVPRVGLEANRKSLPRAFFNSSQNSEPADEEWGSGWGEDLIDWTEEPEQLDLLDEAWYEVSDRHQGLKFLIYTLVKGLQQQTCIAQLCEKWLGITAQNIHINVWCIQDSASPEALAQNALAVVLSAVLLWGFGSILWKLAIVSYALFAAAFRYSFVAVVLLVVVVFIAV